MAKTCNWEGCDRGCYGGFCLMHKPRKLLRSNKHCILCDEIGHSRTQCLKYSSRTPRNKPRYYGKYTDKWRRTRLKWYSLNAPDHAGYYYCHYCGVAITEAESTLDHIKTRSEAPELRYDLNNVVVCCWPDNSKRGSMKYELFIERYYPHKALDKST